MGLPMTGTGGMQSQNMLEPGFGKWLLWLLEAD